MTNHILLLDHGPDREEINFDELLFRLGLEEQEQRVTTVHCDDSYPIKKVRSVSYIESPERELNASEFIEDMVGRINHYPQWKNTAIRALNERMENPKPGLRVEPRSDGIYLIYPKVHMKIDEF